jgi:outer membrane protein assembly factor BamE (lipoprotein component of BamABCDE complex)
LASKGSLLSYVRIVKKRFKFKFGSGIIVSGSFDQSFLPETGGVMGRKSQIWVLTICVAFGSLLVAGCVSTRGKPIKQSKVLEIRKDETNKDEVLERFGAPDAIQYSPRGEEIFIYKYVESREVHVGGAVGVVFRRIIPGVGAATSIGSRKQEVKTDTLMIFMDKDGIVRHYGFTKQTGG